ncbi:ABC transporter permease [Oryzobacter terrae]|uniref:ABC transporter permease n=1 Tax=Oryzobacter terrae TaxID=1620385 RepID=UPI003670F98E
MKSSTFLYWNFRNLLAWGLALLAALYFVVTNSAFSSAGNVFALLQIFSVLVMVASGLAVVMLIGEFDLSIAGVFPLAALIAVKLNDSLGMVPAMGVAVVVAAAIGLLNGAITAFVRIPSLAVTVGSMVLAIGLGFAVAAGQLVQALDYEAGLKLTEPVAGVFSLQSLVQVALAIALMLVARWTWFGRFVYAVGSDRARARASGLPVKRTVIAAFVISASLAGLGGALQGISLATGTAGAEESFLLQAATAAILGGIALTGGKGSLAGVFGAALLLSVISNGLSLTGTDQAIIQLVNGSILLLVVIFDGPLNQFIHNRVRQPQRVQLP